MPRSPRSGGPQFCAILRDVQAASHLQSLMESEDLEIEVGDPGWTGKWWLFMGFMMVGQGIFLWDLPSGFISHMAGKSPVTEWRFRSLGKSLISIYGSFSIARMHV